MKVSVIIPTLNEEKYIDGILGDLVNQTKKVGEVIVVDGLSEDGTKSVARTFAKDFSRFSILDAKKRNVSFQRNKGGMRAKEEWLIFFDADTRIERTFLQKAFEEIGFRNLDAASFWLKTDSRKVKDKIFIFLVNLGFSFMKYLKIPGGITTCMVVRKKAFITLKGFDEITTYAEDSEFVRRLVKNGYHYEFLTRPRQIFSLRRLEREGYVHFLRNHIRLITKLIFNRKIDVKHEYPMGGNVE